MVPLVSWCTMVTPHHGRDVTAAWLEMVLSQYEARGSPGATVTVTSFTVTPGAKPGDGCVAETVKIRVEGLVHGGSQDTTTTTTTTTYHLFAKFLSGTPLEIECMKLSKLHLRELLAHSDVIPELNDFQAKKAGDKYRINIPKFVYGICDDDEYVLVMEDISPAGYLTEDKVSGLDLPHALMAVDGLARLHAVSYAFSHTHNFLQKYPAFIDSCNYINSFYRLSSAIIYDAVIVAAEKKREKYEQLLVKMKSNKKRVQQKLADSLKITEDTTVVCLAHGDAWTNNLMFVNKDSQPRSMMFVDWGLTMWRNPVLDIQYFVHNCTSLSLRRSHLGEILRRYHSTFTAGITDLGVSVDRWAFEDFMAEWRRTRVFGACMGLVNALTAVCEAAENTEETPTPPATTLTAKMAQWVERILPPGLYYAIVTSPRMEFLSRPIMAMSFLPMTRELTSWTNDALQARIFDILTEAYDDGVLDE